MPFNLATLTIVAPYAFTLAMVGLIESLLTAQLVDDVTDTRSTSAVAALDAVVAKLSPTASTPPSWDSMSAAQNSTDGCRATWPRHTDNVSPDGAPSGGGAGQPPGPKSGGDGKKMLSTSSRISSGRGSSDSSELPARW